MPGKKKIPITAKLIGLAIVTAVVVFGVKKQMPIDNWQIQSSYFPVVAVPVDRSQLSQQVLPALPADISKAVKSTSYLYPLELFQTGAESNQKDSQTGPSPYKLKLEDQKAWSSQPRPTCLVSAKKQAARSLKKIVAPAVDAVVFQSPIVPGHEDPHLRYESQFLELAVSIDGQQNQQIANNETMDVKALTELFPENNPLKATMPSKSLPINFAAEAPVSVVTAAVAIGSSPAAKPVPARAAQVFRAWETGRY